MAHFICQGRGDGLLVLVQKPHSRCVCTATDGRVSIQLGECA